MCYPNRMRILAALALAAALQASGVARAHTNLVGVVTASGGWTDNVLGTPNAPDPLNNVAGKQADSYSELRPGLVFTVDTSRSIYRFGYGFSASLYFSHSEANSYSNRVDWSGYFVTGKRSDLVLGLTGEQGRLNTFNTLAVAAPGALPPGGISYLQATAMESFAYELSPRWRVLQTLDGNLYHPRESDQGLPSPDIVSIDNRLALERSFARNAFAVEARVNYIYTSQVVNPDSTITPMQEELINSLIGRWRRQLGNFYESQLDLGAFYVAPIGDIGGNPIVEPAVAAALRYTREEREAELSYAHDAAVNVYAGQVFLTDTATLRGAMPLGNPRTSRWVANGLAGFQYGRQVNKIAGETELTVKVLTADAAVVYRALDDLGVSLHYQFYNQIGERADPVTMNAVAPTYIRNAILLEVAGTIGAESGRTRDVPGRVPLRFDRRDFDGSQPGQRGPAGPGGRPR